MRILALVGRRNNINSIYIHITCDIANNTVGVMLDRKFKPECVSLLGSNSYLMPIMRVIHADASAYVRKINHSIWPNSALNFRI